MYLSLIEEEPKQASLPFKIVFSQIFTIPKKNRPDSPFNYMNKNPGNSFNFT